MVHLATPFDFASMTAIYNLAILAGGQTAFTEPFTEESGREWFAAHLRPQYPMFVYKENGVVLGWAGISPYRQGREALKATVEVSYFVHAQHGGKGIGSALLQHVLHACGQLGYRTILAIILEGNEASIKLVEKFGFDRWAFLPGVAEFNGKALAHLYYGKSL
jgi:L-amino acid N-acyltransferase YncA